MQYEIRASFLFSGFAGRAKGHPHAARWQPSRVPRCAIDRRHARPTHRLTAPVAASRGLWGVGPAQAHDRPLAVDSSLGPTEGGRRGSRRATLRGAHVGCALWVGSGMPAFLVKSFLACQGTMLVDLTIARWRQLLQTIGRLSVPISAPTRYTNINNATIFFRGRKQPMPASTTTANGLPRVSSFYRYAFCSHLSECTDIAVNCGS